MSSTPSLAPDTDVRLRVTEPGESFLVQAPAGSGKTELLTQRYLRVLATVEEPEQVLAITFTRKAASEMRLRVLAACEAAAHTEGMAGSLPPHKRVLREAALAVLKRDAELNWNLLHNPQRLQIRTVDSFCESIARQLPSLAGIGADLEVTEDASLLYEQAADRTIELLGHADSQISDAVATLLRYLDNDVASLRGLLVSMMKKRDQWMRILGRSDRWNELEIQGRRAQLEGALASAVERELVSIRHQFEELLGASDLASLAIYASIAATSEKHAGLASYTGLPKANVEALPVWKSFAEFLTTGKGKSIRQAFDKRNGFVEKQQKDNCKEFFHSLAARPTAEKLCSLCDRLLNKLPEPRYTEDEWQFVCALLTILPVSVASLKVVFAESGRVDFMEMAQAAITALRSAEGPTELGLALGAKLRHVLIDEFQDTSKSQLDLVAALTAPWEAQDGTSLFAVGDPMQSIYAFREAEVTLFTNAARTGVVGTAHGPSWAVSPERLRSNFRSQQDLVQWFNEVFPAIFGDENEISGAIKYAPAAASNPALGGPGVTVHAFAAGDYRGEANRVAEIAKEALARDREGKVAILVRARTHLPPIVDALTAAGVKFRAVKIDPLAENYAVRELDALARALLNLGDRTAWLSVLRAPFCGLKLEDLALLFESEPDCTIWDALLDRRALLDSAAKKLLDRVVPVLENAIQHRGRLPIRLWVERTWISLGGPAALREQDRDTALLAAQAFLDLLESSAASGTLPGSRRFDEMLAELYAPADTSPDVRVEVMTIHNAKGLEWETVILPCLGRKSQRDEKQLLYWREFLHGEEDGLLLGPMRSSQSHPDGATIERYLRTLAEDRAVEERKRLLYVAATRARNRLHLTTTMPKEQAPGHGSLLELLWRVPQVREQFLASAPEPIAEPESKFAPIVIQHRRLTPEWTLPDAPKPIEWNRPAPKIRDEDIHTYEWVGQTRRRIGTVTHAFLQELARRGPDRWTDDLVQTLEPSIRAALTSSGIGHANLSSAVGEVVLALGNVLADERGRWILSPHTEAQSEFAITTVHDDGTVARLRIDRTFVEDSKRWIIDFKITHIEGGSQDDFLRSQVTKYRDDLARYASALKAFDQRTICCGLYFPLQRVWQRVDLDDE